MTDQGADLERALAGLRRQYLLEAPERLAELRAALARAGAGNAEALSQLRLLLHRLAGSGGSYGFDDVSTRARAAELLVRDVLERGGPVTDDDVEVLAGRIAELAEAFRAAR